MHEARDVVRVPRHSVPAELEAPQQLGAGRRRRRQGLQACSAAVVSSHGQKSMKVPPISTPTRKPMSYTHPIRALTGRNGCRLWAWRAGDPHQIWRNVISCGYGIRGMNARQIEIFHAVMRMRSGHRCGRLPRHLPARGEQIAEAGRGVDIGFPLFRTVKGRLLADRGSRAPAARCRAHPARAVAAFTRLTGEISTGGAGLVRVTASSSLSTALMPASAVAQIQRRPIRWSASPPICCPPGTAAETVLAGQADLGLCLSPAAIPGLAVRSLPGPRG